MRTENAPPIRLDDYEPPAFAISKVLLDVVIGDPFIQVTGRLAFERKAEGPMELSAEFFELKRIALDGTALNLADHPIKDGKLTLDTLSDRGVLEVVTAFDPTRNTSLSGIYTSKGRICSQCEAEGFRRIIPFLDRPDVLSIYEVTITADAVSYPYLLSNGNRVSDEMLSDGRRRVVWHDPHPKPAYLFALVAGEFDTITDQFVTMSGRKVDLQIFVDPGDASRALYAMDALKRSMLWDEEEYGREYDLDLFMIVAVRDFNFGAMENKGLNIFNSSLLLADPETATDFDYEAIESVVAHEYFHNWTGNRITCRDWFQLCLKEGLTVFRDQGFTASQRGDAPSRIKDVMNLRARQFREDAGPLAHPVRPAEYEKIDNFYTATVYEKGAELIGMVKTIIGPAAYREGTDRYFSTHDGTAATVEDLIFSFKAEGFDPAAFMGWYGQKGTPRLHARLEHQPGADTAVLTLRQGPPDNNPDWKQVPMPVRFGLLDGAGKALPFKLDGAPGPISEAIVTLSGANLEIALEGLGQPQEVVLSALRHFSAPVALTVEEPAHHRAVRAAFDPDAFNRYEALRELVIANIVDLSEGRAETVEPVIVEAFGSLLAIAQKEPAFVSLALGVPGVTELAAYVERFDPDALEAARTQLLTHLAQVHGEKARALHHRLAQHGPFSASPEAAVSRALRNALMALSLRDGVDGAELARACYEAADNMTDRMAALSALDVIGHDGSDAALADFRRRLNDQPLVMDKWFALQARGGGRAGVERVSALMLDLDFDMTNPNRARSVLGSFGFFGAQAFHREDGAGYRLLIEAILQIDARNPALASRLMGAFEIWPKLEKARKEKASEMLQELSQREGISPNLSEIVNKIAAAG
jgi:aminopeptidase N